ncbi:hypothetical protein HHL19_31000 [Streptomyces sp. R302]|uniref:DUF6924 domain-containing protein n=1 Tax=unclassified Streptomyces TaxID=2593676 RepID=UPI00145CA60B|nr:MULTISPECIES: hypothetical protein [unclassified Streptomyces]NML53708.1 hypothetical protein [Streptomyces sp. R301]NML82967.1 hypothetical protein [Streptomyces sp. R302]
MTAQQRRDDARRAIETGDTWAAFVVRTDFGDEEAWREVLAELGRPDGEVDVAVRVLDAPCWAGASVEEVLTAVDDEDGPAAVFVADRHTMGSPVRALLAVDTLWEDESALDPVYYQELVDSPAPREFRLRPAAVPSVHVNLELGNLGFEEFAAEAAEGGAGVLGAA